MRKVIVNILMLLIVMQAFSQVAKEDFVNINKVYTTNKRFYIKTHYEFFKNKDSKVPYQIKEGEIKKDVNMFYSKTGEIEIIQNPNYCLMVNHQYKKITLMKILKNTNGEEMFNETSYMQNFDKILGGENKVSFKKESSQQNSYTVSIPSSAFSEVKLIYNKKNWFVEKMIFYSREVQSVGGEKESPRLEITYSEINPHPVFTSDIFTYTRFINNNRGKFSCTQEYRNYALINHYTNQ